MIRKLTIMAITMMLVLSMANTSRAARDNDFLVENGEYVPIPLTYTVKNVIAYLGEQAGFLNNADDLFIDKQGILYVADAGNNRILKLTREGNVLDIFEGPQDNRLKNPRGIYVDEEGDLYIADTGNKRIVHLTAQGEFVEEFTRPDSALLPDTFTFDPSKVYISHTGYIYAIKAQQFMMIDAYNRFRGYVGANEVGFNFNQMLIRMFASPEQKRRLVKRQPPPYSNFLIHDDGMIYATTLGRNQQIRKINSVGKNIYKETTFGFNTFSGNKIQPPQFVDLAVDKNGIISAIDQRSGYILQYDQEGNLLTVFGGLGSVKGEFEIPCSIVVDQEGCIYVLDGTRNNIQVFEPTKFITYIHQAVKLYSDGRYNEAMGIWEKVLQIDENYSLAHKGIAKALYKEERYSESMEAYKMANDKTGYSEAFAQHRHELFRRYFGFVLLTIIIIIALVILLVKTLKNASLHEVKKYTTWQGGI